jgi:hypothetical protein
MNPGTQSPTILKLGTQIPTISLDRQTHSRQFVKTGAQITICEYMCLHSRDL